MLAEAYELASKGDQSGAGDLCRTEFTKNLHPIFAVEGSDFLRLSDRKREALELAREGVRESVFFLGRCRFAESLALRDLGDRDGARMALIEAVANAYSNEERFKLEWAGGVSATEYERLLAGIRRNREKENSEGSSNSM
jgi:hypothetical protein